MDSLARRRLRNRMMTDSMVVRTSVSEIIPGTNTTVQVPGVLYDGLACRISQRTLKANERGMAQEETRENKLFCAPEIDIPPGADIEVTRGVIASDGTMVVKTLLVERAGAAMPYDFHQEIPVNILRDWA